MDNGARSHISTQVPNKHESQSKEEHDNHNHDKVEHTKIETQPQEVLTWDSILGELGVSKNVLELTRQDILGKHFSSLQRAEMFFNMYARGIGFSVRKGQMRKRKTGSVGIRTWWCSREGFRNTKIETIPNYEREPRALTRSGCTVQFRVNRLKKTDFWVVKEFITQHSHPVVSADHVKFLRSNRVLTGGTMETAKVLRRAGVKSSQIMSFMAQLLGGYGNVPFLPKDLYNKLNQEDISLADSDASKAIGYLQHKADQDTNFFGKFSYDNDKRLENVLWSDSRSRSDYKIFGHTLAFDTTYKSNKFAKPLLVLVGINHHHSSTIFAVALIQDETVETYRWALKTFVECMDGVTPQTVITDGDVSMRQAIVEVMPDTIHRLCTWHIERNAIANVKDRNFLTHFQKFFSIHFGLNEFDEEWKNMILKFALQQNQWVKTMYQKRHMWAATFFKDSFYGGMTTTQRCEGMNYFLKSDGNSKMSLAEFVRGIDMSLSWLRHKEAKEDFDSSASIPVIGYTNMIEVERQCAEVYTRSIFFKVREEISKEGTYMVTKVEDLSTKSLFTLVKYGKKQWFRSVQHDKYSDFFACDCHSFPTKGIPCRHVFTCMKHMNMTTLPKSMIMARWTKNAKSDMITHVSSSTSDIQTGVQASRFGYITAKCSEIAFLASKGEQVYEHAKTELQKLAQDLKFHLQPSITNESSSGPRCSNPTPLFNPPYSKCKGSGQKSGPKAKKRKQCSLCKKMGHNRQTCGQHTITEQRGSKSDNENCDSGIDKMEHGLYKNERQPSFSNHQCQIEIDRFNDDPDCSNHQPTSLNFQQSNTDNGQRDCHAIFPTNWAPTDPCNLTQQSQSNLPPHQIRDASMQFMNDFIYSLSDAECLEADDNDDDWFGQPYGV